MSTSVAAIILALTFTVVLIGVGICEMLRREDAYEQQALEESL